MDNLYAQLIEQVKMLAEDFFAEVSVDSEGKGRHVSIFIQVRRSSEDRVPGRGVTAMALAVESAGAQLITADSRAD